MTKFNFKRTQIADNQFLQAIMRDASGGMNTRQQGLMLGENQFEDLLNIDLIIPGKRTLRNGSIEIADDPDGANAVIALKNFVIDNATDQLLRICNGSLKKWEGSGNWSSELLGSISGTDVSIIAGKESGLSPDDIVIVQDGSTNAFRVASDGTTQDLGDTNTSPPKSTVGTWFGNRFWYLLNELLYWSDAYDEDYSGAFDRTTNAFRLPVGEERMVTFTRDLGMIVGGQDAIWAIFPSAVPVATDRPQPILPDYGIVSKTGWCLGGDDIYFFSHDGLRALRRTVQDKLQVGVSYPLSYPLKDEFDTINWARIDEVSLVYHDNRVICTVPTGATGFMRWVYYTAMQSINNWEGQSPRCVEKYKVGGEEFLYYGHSSDGKVYKDFDGFTDEGTTASDGTAITYCEISRKIDLGTPLQRKEGHNLRVRAEESGDITLNVYVQLDDQGWNLVGTINLEGTFISFPTSFPVVFQDTGIVKENFHLRPYGKWNYIQYKIEMTDAVANPVTLIETSLTATADPYLEE